jgi:hypothetical protein
MIEPVFLTRESVESIHAASIQKFGGSLGIRDENVLDKTGLAAVFREQLKT